MNERFFAPCPRGLEAALASELTAQGGELATAAEGGVSFAGPIGLAYRVNLESRLASRVLWQIAHGDYRSEDDLYRLAHGIDWNRHFDVGHTLRVDVAATRSPLQSIEFATLKLKDAICDRFRADSGKRPSVDKERPDVRVHAYLTEREATLYLDTSGEALFKRGWRRDADVAPLRENLAAGVLALAGWAPGTPLLDPMCGAGTIAIEAALAAADIAPGLRRTFGFQKLAWFDGPTWQRIRQHARDRVRTAPPEPSIFASDIDRHAVARCRSNAVAAGVAEWIESTEADVLARAAPCSTGLLVSNPPYGVRLDDAAKLAAFYPRLGDALKQHFVGWTACLLTGDQRLPKLIGLRPSKRTPLHNGAIECRLFRFEIVLGRPQRRPHAASSA